MTLEAMSTPESDASDHNPMLAEFVLE
jgi:endonuclease/exonuclease/phosphatase (EEP) superfamily protein YafD